jgi:anti-sigma B factor antagonist
MSFDEVPSDEMSSDDELPPDEASDDDVPSTVRHEGDLDIVTSEDVKRQLASLVEGGCTTVTLDLRSVGFVDSSGLGALVAVHNYAQARGAEFVVSGAPTHVRDLFSLTRLDNLLTVAPGDIAEPEPKPDGDG